MQELVLYNEVAENTVIGSIVLDESIMPKVIGIIPDHTFFYLPINSLIYSKLVKMFNNNERIDYVTVLDEINALGVVEHNQIRSHLLKAIKVIPSLSRAEKYASIVREKFKLRLLANLPNEINSGLHKVDDVDSFINRIITKLESAKGYGGVESILSVQDLLIDNIGSIEEEPIYTSFEGLDNITSGFKKSDLVFLAARPGMGKTSFALCIAKNVSCDHKVLIFSLEMSTGQLTSRLLSIESNLGQEKVRSCILLPDEWRKIEQALDAISTYNIVISDSPRVTVQKMKSEAKSLSGLGLIVIDYLQLIMPSEIKSNRVLEITEITRQLKIMAKELNTPIICLSQLSRASEQRADHRPVLSDLRDSGSIEQDADVVIALYRDSYYSNDEKIDPEESECIVLKNRHGRLGKCKLRWEANSTKFSDYKV